MTSSRSQRSQPGATNRSIRPVHGVVIAQKNQDFNRLLAVSWVVLAITTLGASVLGWFVAGRVLRPLREMASTARTITAGNLHARLALTGPNDEFKRLGDAFDDLLGRASTAFEAHAGSSPTHRTSCARR